MAELNKFPFKSMISVINYLHEEEKNGDIDIGDIQDVSNACYSDTTEILEMLAYLTSFGQVKENLNGWYAKYGFEYTNKKYFRETYLENMVKILLNLQNEPQSISYLTQVVKIPSEKETTQQLHFLKSISAYGYVLKTTKGWKLGKYDNSEKSIEKSETIVK